MSPKFKILDKKNIHDGFFKMNEVTLKYKNIMEIGVMK